MGFFSVNDGRAEPHTALSLFIFTTVRRPMPGYITEEEGQYPAAPSRFLARRGRTIK